MSFDLTHWQKPRSTIACTLQNNDFAYITHGVKQLAEFLGFIDENVINLKSKTLLDFGSGTGRFSRLSSFLFKDVVGYDPVIECLKEGEKELALTNREISLIDVNKISFTTDSTKIKTNYFDYVVSHNVFEHLIIKDSNIAFDIIVNSLKLNGIALLLLHVDRNKDLIIKYKLDKLESKTIGMYKYIKK